MDQFSRHDIAPAVFAPHRPAGHALESRLMARVNRVLPAGWLPDQLASCKRSGPIRSSMPATFSLWNVNRTAGVLF
jgi:hypothetical protein